MSFISLSYHLKNMFHTLILLLWCQGGHFSGIYRKVQLKPSKWVKLSKSDGVGEDEHPVEALMVLKYGGVLTHAGRKQVTCVTFFSPKFPIVF